MKVTAIRKGTPDKDGRRIVYIRINDGPKRTYKATRMRASDQEWDTGKNRFKLSHPQATTYNALLRKQIVETEAGYLGEGATMYKDGDLVQYFLHCIDIDWVRKAPETLRQYRSEVNKLKDFTTPVKLSDVTVHFLNRYRSYLYSIGNSENTAWKSLKALRTVIRKAHREKLIEDNPFSRFDMPRYKNPVKSFLTEEEIAIVERYSIDKATPPHLALAAKWFVIGCYSGLRYGDMAAFSKERDIKNGRLLLRTAKTGEIVSIKFKERLRELFARVKYKPLSQLNQVYNRNLKDIQKACGIRAVLKSHVSRHTFAVYCADQGLGIETTAKLLGHRDIKTTSIYFKISNKKMDSEIDKLF